MGTAGLHLIHGLAPADMADDPDRSHQRRQEIGVIRRPPDSKSGHPSTLRAAFRPTVTGDVRAVDGAWWPRSSDLATELPALVAALSRRGFIVARVAYHQTSWNNGVGKKLATGGTTVQLGWFRTIDPHLVSLTSRHGNYRLDLLVVPADSSPLLAERVFATIQHDNHHNRASDILAAHAPVQAEPPVAPAAAHADRVAKTAWESEGGATACRS
ncbi:DUF5994 family protein [Phytoactinopolyspora limicola]|uniref:DUF5994 family protein n=1 Tax=Phytoactinopolyspora limicola TaxID=2715536 RepID=UPI0014091F11|nr:DUF5994 family protein [Phytoactinopolyspora limicola]